MRACRELRLSLALSAAWQSSFAVLLALGNPISLLPLCSRDPLARVPCRIHFEFRQVNAT
jgi:hypothetical protein